VPSWTSQQFDVWYCDPREVARNILANPDYVNDFALSMNIQSVKMNTITKTSCWVTGPGSKRYMSFYWMLLPCIEYSFQDILTTDPDTLGVTFVPIILGSDKTMVSVSTGNNEYYLLYLSIGNVHNNVHRAYWDVLCLVGFLAIPKSKSLTPFHTVTNLNLAATNKHKETEEFHDLRRQIFHSSLAKILKTFKKPMLKPEVTCFGNGHYRRILYGLGPYIADYEEHVLLTSIVRNWCPRFASLALRAVLLMFNTLKDVSLPVENWMTMKHYADARHTERLSSRKTRLMSCGVILVLWGLLWYYSFACCSVCLTYENLAFY
jgi:hypothetical protein